MGSDSGPPSSSSPQPPEDPEDPEAADSSLQQEDPVIAAILGPAPLLVVCSNLGVALYDCNSWDCLGFRPYAGTIDAKRIRPCRNSPAQRIHVRLTHGADGRWSIISLTT